MDARSQDHAAAGDADLAAVQIRMTTTGHPIRCGPGWAHVVRDLDHALADIDPDYYLFTVGRQRGVLTFDAEPSTSAAVNLFRDLISSAEQRASRTCELCGAPGVRRTYEGLTEVLCARHRASATAKSPSQDRLTG